MAGIAYVGNNAGSHLFHFIADGNRPILEIYVDVKDGADMEAELPIYVNGVGRPLDDRQVTKGLTKLNIFEAPADVDGIPTGIMVIPNMEYIAVYVLPRIHTLMARVYVPKTGSEG